MSATHVMLTAEQFSQLATKDYIDQTLDRKLEEKLEEKLKNFVTKDDFNSLSRKVDDLDKKVDNLDKKLDLRFNQLDYKIESSFDYLNGKFDKIVERHEKDISELNLFTADHAIRIKRLEFRSF